MQRNTVLGVVILIIVIIGAAALTVKSRKSPTAATTPTPSPSTQAGSTASPTASASGTQTASQNVVTYTDQGFSPATLTISQGDTVQFVNNSSTSVWVASNPHPTHTDYPGFDALRAYSPNETYSFTFTKPGTWGYHNHLNPSQGGTIVVQ